jgi:hypothetical protein
MRSLWSVISRTDRCKERGAAPMQQHRVARRFCLTERMESAPKAPLRRIMPRHWMVLMRQRTRPSVHAGTVDCAGDWLAWVLRNAGLDISGQRIHEFRGRDRQMVIVSQRPPRIRPGFHHGVSLCGRDSNQCEEEHRQTCGS